MSNYCRAGRGTKCPRGIWLAAMWVKKALVEDEVSCFSLWLQQTALEQSRAFRWTERWTKTRWKALVSRLCGCGGAGRWGFVLVHGPGCESSSPVTPGSEHHFSKCMKHHFLWGGKKIREPLRPSPICMAGEVLLLELSKGVLVTPYCL